MVLHSGGKFFIPFICIKILVQTYQKYILIKQKYNNKTNLFGGLNFLPRFTTFWTIGAKIKGDLPEGVEDSKHHRLGREAELEVPQVVWILQPLEGSGWKAEVAFTAGASSILLEVVLLLSLAVLEAGVPDTGLPAHPADRIVEVRIGEGSLEH